MKYNIELEPAQLSLIGEILDREPHGNVAAIVASVQTQITAQDAAEKVRSEAAWQAARGAWFDGEQQRRAAEALQNIPQPKSRRSRSSKKGK